MSSQLNVDTIVDKAGSGGTNVKVANTSTYVSDGGAVTQNTVQSLCKIWCSTNHNSTGTHTINDSFNTSSVTDGGVGRTTNTYTNNFSSGNYSAVLGTTNDNNQSGIETGPSTSSIVIVTYQHNGTTEDTTAQNSAMFGDLA